MKNLKQAKVIQMQMTNLPGNPWFTYHKLNRYGNSIRFSSLPAKDLQYQAEHFWLTDDEFDGLVRDGQIKGGK